MEEGPFLQGGRRDSPVLRVSSVQVTIKAPRMLWPAPDPSATSPPPVSPLTPSHHSRPQQSWDAPLSDDPDCWCPVWDILAQKGAALPLFHCGPSDAEICLWSLFPLPVRVGLCGVVRQRPGERLHPHSKLRPLPVQDEDSDGF